MQFVFVCVSGGSLGIDKRNRNSLLTWLFCIKIDRRRNSNSIFEDWHPNGELIENLYKENDSDQALLEIPETNLSHTLH